VTAGPGLLDPAPVVLHDVPLAIDPGEVRAFRGYQPLRLRSPSARAGELSAARAAVARVMAPRLAYRSVAVVAVEAHRLALADGSAFRIPWIGEHWGDVEAVTAAVATIGDEVERLVEAARTSASLDAGAVDAAASAAVECLAEWGNDHLCRLGVAQGRRVTNRISPGLAGWDVAEQPRLLALCPTAHIGVTLGTDRQLHPAKSISFLVGVGRSARVDHYFVQCRRCWVSGCPQRRAPAVATVHRDA
jgi:hypothetical protein